MTEIRPDHDPGRAELVTHNSGDLTAAREPARLVAVLGMHRSGTSGVAELLGSNGLDLGATASLMPATEFNPHGYFEIQALSRFNESVLERLSATWWAPPTMETVHCAAEDYIPEARLLWRSVSEAFAGTAPPVVKDPRLSLLLPIWRHILPPSTLFILCMRDPLAVARSLFARDQIDIPVGLAIWEMYNITALQGVMGSRVLFVDVDRLARSADARVELISNVRAATGMPSAPDLNDTFDGTLLSSASSQRDLNEFLTVCQLSLYQSVRRLPHDVVQVDDLRYLQVPGATLRAVARNRKRAYESDEQLKSRQESDERAGSLDERLRELVASQSQRALEASALEMSAKALSEQLEDQRRERAQEVEREAALSRSMSLQLDKLSAVLKQDATTPTGAPQGVVPRLEVLADAALAMSEALSMAKSEVAQLRSAAGRATTLERAQAVTEELLHDLSMETESERAGRISAEQERVAVEERLQKLQRELTTAHESRAAMEREQIQFAERLKDSASQIETLQAELAQVHALYGAAFSSRSWRWTRVLRRERVSTAATAEQLSVNDVEDPTPIDGNTQAPLTSPVRTSRVAVVVHVFYPDLWDDLCSQLANLPEPFDLFVSLVEGHSEHLAQRIRDHYLKAVINIRPNRGRDIAPFLGFVASGELSGYRAVLKMHTKRSHHRIDGDEWRKSLWHGLLPSAEGARTIVDRMVGDPDVGCIVPRGNVMGEESLGSNLSRMTELMARVGIDLQVSDVEFAAGSMYWLDGEIVELLRALVIDPLDDFEPEEGQIDGTTAHAMERLVGVLVKRRGQRIAYAEDLIGESTTPAWAQRRRPRVLAFYLPQFHRIAENDAWWGDGFTEWVNVDAAEPWHSGQMFPRRPIGPLGKYDLSDPAVLAIQAQLAQQFGVDGFLVYHYWFSGRRLLEAPMNAVLADKSLNFPYALVWANENWTRAWDGLDRDVLIGQDYKSGWEEALVDSMIPHLKDPRYIRLDGHPLVVIFKPSLLPNLQDAAARIRKAALERGVGPVHVAGILHDRHVGGVGEQFLALDSWIEFPPLSGPAPIDVTEQLTDRAGVRGRIYSYPGLVDQATFAGLRQGRRVHPGVMPSWDNTPRRRNGASSFAGANAADFRRWMIAIRRGLAGLSAPGEMLVCVNAWNEWAETAYLEPDQMTGFANLEAVHSAFGDVLPPASANREEGSLK